MDSNIVKYVLIAVAAIALIVIVILRSRAAEAQRQAKADAEHEHKLEQEKKAKAAQVERQLREARAKQEDEARRKAAQEETARKVRIALYNFQNAHPDGKEVRLVGKPDEFAFAEAGQICEVVQDDVDRYVVLADGATIGALPSLAIKFAAQLNKDPAELCAIVTETDYDVDRERDIYTVYIA